MSRLLSERVKKVPSTDVSSDRYLFLKLSEAEPDLGVPTESGYVLSSTVEGVRSWIPQGATGAVGTDTQLTYNNNGVAAGANLYYDDVNERLGVGVVTPTSKLDVAGAITVNTNVNINSTATTHATTVQKQIASFPASEFRSGKIIVQAYDTLTNEVQVSELLVAHNGTIAIATEYGVVYTGTMPIVVYDVDILFDSVRVLAQRTSSNPTQYTVSETLLSVLGNPAVGSFSWDSSTASPGQA